MLNLLRRLFIRRPPTAAGKVLEIGVQVTDPTRYDKILTTHAIVRYLDRFEGRDIRAELVTQQVLNLMREVNGDGKFISNGILYTVVNHRIVSIARPNPNQPVVSGLNDKSTVPRRWSF